METGQQLERKEIQALQRFTQHPPRYNEASLVKKLEELGIGRPSTYAPTISTIQQREYVTKGDKGGEEKELVILTLKGDTISQQAKQTVIGAERGKLVPTDVGTVVNDFLLQYFPEIMDYNFTAEVEKKFDDIAEGKTEWTQMMKDFYGDFEPEVEKTLNAKSESIKWANVCWARTRKAENLYLSKSGVSAPQIGTAEDEEKPRFAQMKNGQSLETITLEEALELFKLPRDLGTFEGTTVSHRYGTFRPRLAQQKYVSLPKGSDPMSVTLKEAIKLIIEKRQAEVERHLRKFEEKNRNWKYSTDATVAHRLQRQ